MVVAIKEEPNENKDDEPHDARPPHDSLHSLNRTKPSNILVLPPEQAQLCQFPMTSFVQVVDASSAFLDECGRVHSIAIDLSPTSTRESLYTLQATDNKLLQHIPESHLQFAPTCAVWFQPHEENHKVPARILSTYSILSNQDEESNKSFKTEYLYSIQQETQESTPNAATDSIPSRLLYHGVLQDQLQYRPTTVTLEQPPSDDTKNTATSTPSNSNKTRRDAVAVKQETISPPRVRLEKNVDVQETANETASLQKTTATDIATTTTHNSRMDIDTAITQKTATNDIVATATTHNTTTDENFDTAITQLSTKRNPTSTDHTRVLALQQTKTTTSVPNTQQASPPTVRKPQENYKVGNNHANNHSSRPSTTTPTDNNRHIGTTRNPVGNSHPRFVDRHGNNLTVAIAHSQSYRSDDDDRSNDKKGTFLENSRDGKKERIKTNYADHQEYRHASRNDRERSVDSRDSPRYYYRDNETSSSRHDFRPADTRDRRAYDYPTRESPQPKRPRSEGRDYKYDDYSMDRRRNDAHYYSTDRRRRSHEDLRDYKRLRPTKGEHPSYYDGSQDDVSRRRHSYEEDASYYARRQSPEPAERRYQRQSFQANKEDNDDDRFRHYLDRGPSCYRDQDESGPAPRYDEQDRQIHNSQYDTNGDYKMYLTWNEPPEKKYDPVGHPKTEKQQDHKNETSRVSNRTEADEKPNEEQNHPQANTFGDDKIAERGLPSSRSTSPALSESMGEASSVDNTVESSKEKEDKEAEEWGKGVALLLSVLREHNVCSEECVWSARKTTVTAKLRQKDPKRFTDTRISRSFVERVIKLGIVGEKGGQTRFLSAAATADFEQKIEMLFSILQQNHNRMLKATACSALRVKHSDEFPDTDSMRVFVAQAIKYGFVSEAGSTNPASVYLVSKCTK